MSINTYCYYIYESNGVGSREPNHLSMGPWDHRSSCDFLFNKFQSTSTLFWSTNKSSRAVTTHQERLMIGKGWRDSFSAKWQHESRKKNLVLVPWVLSAVSPCRRAKAEGFRLTFALSIIAWHCSAVAKFGKYKALGFQLSTCTIVKPKMIQK